MLAERLARPNGHYSEHVAIGGGAVAAQLTSPLAGYVEDLHLQESAPCRAHNEGSGRHHAGRTSSSGRDAWRPMPPQHRGQITNPRVTLVPGERRRADLGE